MFKKIIKFLIVAIYTVLVVSYCFFADKSLNIILSSKVFFAHFYSFPIFFGVVISLFAILIFIVGFVNDKTEYFRKLKFLFPLIILILSMVYIFCSTNVKRLIATEDNRDTIKLVELNAQNTMNSDAVIKIFKDFDTDIAVLPEFGGHIKGDKPEDRLIDLMESEGINSQNYNFYSSVETEGNIAPVTIVVKKVFNEYKQIDNKQMTRFGTVYLQSKNKDFPDIIGLHTAPPLPGLMEMWKMDIDLIGKKIIPENKDAIVLGDFNATDRHGSLNLIDSHEDVLDYLPRFNRGTWGLFLPGFLRTGIDHVYIPHNKYLVKSVDLLKFNGPDHMGVFLELTYK